MMGAASPVSVGWGLPGEDDAAWSAPLSVNHAPADCAPSCRDISPVWNACAFRRSFPAAWAQYLRDTYRTAYAVERAFGIDGKTARDWINGKRDPSGSFVAAVVARDPNAMKILGRAAA